MLPRITPKNRPAWLRRAGITPPLTFGERYERLSWPRALAPAWVPLLAIAAWSLIVHAARAV